MVDFCRVQHPQGKRTVTGAMAGVVIVSMVFVAVFGGACKKKRVVALEPAKPSESGLEAVVTNRMHDASYREELKQNLKEQRVKAKERNVVVERMTALIARARAKLPAGADDAAVKAELEKDPEWRELESKNQQLIGEIEVTLARAREAVRQRMLQESRDVKAVSEGRAKAADASSTVK